MGLHSGKYGRINGVNTMRQWTINEEEAQPKGIASNTLLGTNRERGVRKWTGSYQAYGAVPVAGIMPGSVFSFVGYGSPGNDVSGAVGQRYEGDAIVDRVVINWNWQGGEMLSHTVNFNGNLVLTKNAAGADPGDTVAPVMPPVGGTKLQYSLYDLAAFTTLPNLTSMSLTLSASNNSYVNSSTYLSNRLWTGWVGGPIDWTLTVQQQDDERVTGIFDIGDFVHLKAFTDATQFWSLKYGIVKNFGNYTVNRETGAIISRAITFDMKAYYGSAAGAIALPSGTQWWPF